MTGRLRLHILFWGCYVLFQTYIEFAWISASYASISPIERFWMALLQELTQLVIKLPLIYLILYLFYSQKGNLHTGLRIGAGILLLGIAIVLHRFLIVKFLLPYVYHEKSDASYLFNINRLISSLLDLLFVIVLAVAAKQYRLSRQWKEKEKLLVKEKLEAELKFLRTQTNPHFLFNTLNNIYALARKKSDATPDVVMKLSKLLRFMLYESKRDMISIAEEIRVLDDYIELEKIRYNNRLHINFRRSVDSESQTIAPLILLPFVENAFKHGASEMRFDSFIKLELLLKEGHLFFSIENSRDDDGTVSVDDNIGLSNVRRQLQLMYPEHRLQIDKNKDSFKVILNINLLNHAAA